MAGQMMTMDEVRVAARYRGDLEGLEDRHSDLDLNREANLSVRQLRMKLANEDVLDVLTPTSILSLPSSPAVTGGSWAEIDWPTDAILVRGLDVRVDGSWLTIPQGEFAQRLQGPIQGQNSFSVGSTLSMWVPRSLPQPSTTTRVAGKIMLFPVPNGGSYILWYLREWTDLTIGTHLFPGQESWVDWVIWDVVVKSLKRDVGPQGNKQLDEAMAERDRCWMTIQSTAKRLATDGPVEVTNRYSGLTGRYPRMVD